jgi:hypothetical protein
MAGVIKRLGLCALVLAPFSLAGASTNDPWYPRFDIGSTAPAEVTADIEILIGEFAARWSSPKWHTLLDLWDPDEETPYYLLSHQADWLIGWDQLRGYFSENPSVPGKDVSELNSAGMTQMELVHYEYRNESDLQAMRYTPNGIRVRQIAPDLALAIWYVKFDYKPHLRPAMGETFKANAVFRDTADGWKFIHYAETPDSAIMYVERLYEDQASPDFAEEMNRLGRRGRPGNE